MPKIDVLSLGLSATSITKQLVRDILTEEELSQKYSIEYEDVLQMTADSYEIDEAIELLQKIKGLESVSNIEVDLAVYYGVVTKKTKSLDAVTYWQTKIQKQIRDAKSKELKNV